MDVSTIQISLHMYFYNTGFMGETVLITGLLTDDLREVKPIGMRVGDPVYVQRKLNFRITLNRPVSRLTIKMSLGSYATHCDIGFAEYAQVDLSGEVRNFDQKKREEMVNSLTLAQLDAIRKDYYLAPDKFDETYLEFLENKSLQLEKAHFLKDHPTLLALLNADINKYFQQPLSFSSERLLELDKISQMVSFRRFLDANSVLSQQLADARSRINENPQAFPPPRLQELEKISLAVEARHFPIPQTVNGPDRTAGIIAIAVCVIVVVFVILWPQKRAPQQSKPNAPNPSQSRAESPGKTPPAPGPAPHEKSGNLSVEEAPKTLEEALAFLGLRQPTTRDAVDAAYRELMMKYHPDHVAHLGNEFQEMAQRKAKHLNIAYDMIRAQWRQTR